MTARLLILAVLMAFTVSCSALGQVTQTVKMKSVPYEAWGLQFEVPRVSRKVSLKPTEEVELWDLYLYGDFVYFIKVVKIPPNALTSTIIEQDIQAESNLFAKRGPTRRWEMRDGLFKALNYYARVDEDIPEAAVELGKILRGRTACVSCAWTPLGDEKSSMLLIGVLGPKGRDRDIENMARLFVNQLVRLTAVEQPGPTPELRPPLIAAQPPRPDSRPPTKTRPDLKKDDIEILGRIESISSDRKSLVMQAERVALPGVGPITLDPKRSKTVRLEKLPQGAVVGARIIVIGKNKGVGTPIKADWLEVVP